MLKKVLIYSMLIFTLTLTGCLDGTSGRNNTDGDTSSYSSSDNLAPSNGETGERKSSAQSSSHTSDTEAWKSNIDKQSQEVKDKSKIDVKKYVKEFRKGNNDMLSQFKTSKITSQKKLCLAKSRTIALVTEALHSLEFLGKIIAIFFVFLIIFDLFIKNHSRSENGILSGILSALAYTFIVVFLINLDSIANWWQKDIVDVFLQTCRVGKGTEGLILSLVLSQFVYIILFLSRVFGSVIMLGSIFKMVSTPQGAENNIGKAFMWFLGGVMLGLMPNILSWIGIFN